MATTNHEIITRTRWDLAKDGLLAVGEQYADGIEELHTFAYWKECGFSVRKGEKALVKIPIYKYASKKIMVNGEEKESGRCFPKLSAFFAARQVEPIKEKGAARC